MGVWEHKRSAGAHGAHGAHGVRRGPCDENGRVTSSLEPVAVEPMHPGSEPARRILYRYFDELVSRYYGRQATQEEIDAAISDYPSDDLAPPGGVLLVARDAGAPVGCAGLCVLPGGVGEVTRVFVVSSARGTGLGGRLMREIEVHARALGVRELRLTVRRDLVEAQRLYARVGYEQTAPLDDRPYADHWLRKRLA
jgi:GNAT superfamily N-acetyltransferase